MTSQTFASVWDAIEDTAAEAARLLGVTQPRVSDLMRGKIDLFSLDTLVDMAVRLGLRAAQQVGASNRSGLRG